MRLPATDLGIMAEHLATHEGMINKFKIYYMTVRNPVLKNLLYRHIHILREHVRVMLEFIDPSKAGQVHLPSLKDIHLKFGNEQISEQEKDITLEARATAKLMSSNNFMSALMMKDVNVKHAHIEMALQEERFQSLYNQIIKHIDGEFTPKVSEKMQLLTLHKYYHILSE